MDGGQTIHSKFGVKVGCDETSSSYIEPKSSTARQLAIAKLVVMDEASQIHRFNLECVDRLYREITGRKNVAFGGCCFLLAGDFRQCTPVVDLSAIENSSNACVTRSQLWRHFRVFNLSRNMRALATELAFMQHLIHTGNGTLETIDRNQQLTRIPDEMVSIGNLVDEIYGQGEIRAVDLSAQNVGILCPVNEDAITLNQSILDRMSSNYFV